MSFGRTCLWTQDEEIRSSFNSTTTQCWRSNRYSLNDIQVEREPNGGSFATPVCHGTGTERSAGQPPGKLMIETAGASP